MFQFVLHSTAFMYVEKMNCIKTAQSRQGQIRSNFHCTIHIQHVRRFSILYLYITDMKILYHKMMKSEKYYDLAIVLSNEY